MKHLQAYSQFLNEKKPAGAPDWHDSDAPDAEGRFKELSPKKLAAWLIKTRDKDLRKITGSLNQQIVFNRNEDPEYADKMEKTRQEVYKQLGREDLMDSKQTQDEMKHIKPLNEAPAFGSHDKGDYSDEMSYGQLERCMDYSKMIRERIKAGQSLDPWMHSQIAVAENELNSVFDALDGDDGVVESERDWNDKRRGPHPYTATLSDEDEKEKEAQMKKQAKMDDDDPGAYQEMPGDKEAREQGKVKTSKHVKSYHELYGDDEETNEAKVEVERYVRSHGKRPKGWGRWLFSYNRDGSEMFQIPSSMNWADAQKWAKNKAKEDGKNYVYVMESFELTEGVMSDLHQMAGKVKDEAEFVKQFFKEYGAKVKKTADSIDWVKSLYQDTVDESLTEAYSIITATGVSNSEVKFLKTLSTDVKKQGPGVYITVSGDNKQKVLDYLKKIKAEVSESLVEASKVLKFKDHGIDDLKELSDLINFLRDQDIDWNQSKQSIKFDSVEDAQTAIDWLNESLNEKEKKQSTDRTPLEDDAMETGLKKKADETGVPIGIIRAVARRGLAAWRTGHRPGATQQQWAYARVNSFLVKAPGTWGGADADLAKEVRDGGHDKKLKKA